MNRMLEFSSKLGADAFIVQTLTGHEEISRLFEYQVTLLSEKPDINPEQLLGTNATVHIEMPAGLDPRYINGFITRFGIQGEIATPAFKGNRGFVYQAVLSPWLWFLTRTSTCEIFQGKHVPDVVKEVFARHGALANSGQRLNHSEYLVSENCVQYRESDFNFVSRLLEREGIYYAFEHTKDGHKMWLYDDLTLHKPRPDYGSFAFQKIQTSSENDAETISIWNANSEVQTGRYVLNDYNFLTPKVDLLKAQEKTRKHPLASLEMFDYHGEYSKPAEGDFYSQLRIEEQHCRYQIAQGAGNLRGIEAGRTFMLTDHPIGALNQEYLVLSSDINAVNNSESSAEGGGAEFKAQFSVIPKTTQFRPARTTPDSLVKGPQTAMVVGPSNEEIHTDEHGRVKVQFHWDRYGKRNENSSCWVRVAHPLAGKAWGMVTLPRIGQEVVVEFLEGDPDCPIITGSVYNAEQKPPYKVPDNKTRSGIITRSSPGGSASTFNELRFEDKKDSEQVFLRAQKDFELHTEHDRLEWIGNESHLIVKKDALEQVEGDAHLSMKKGVHEEIGGDLHLSITGNHNEKVGSDLSQDVGMAVHLKAGQSIASEAGQVIHLKGGMNVVIEAGTNITLKVGGNFITVGPEGVSIKGTMVMINSGGAAGSGPGASPKAPTAPKAPKEADDGVQS